MTTSAYARWKAAKLAEGLCGRCGENPQRESGQRRHKGERRLKSCQDCADGQTMKRQALLHE